MKMDSATNETETMPESNTINSKTRSDTVASKNAGELTSLILNSCPEILDTRLSDKIARSKVFELLLLNAWRRRRADIEKTKTKMVNAEKLLLKSKEQQCTLESLLRFERQRYQKLLITAELVQSENHDIFAKYQCEQQSNDALKFELDEKISEAQQLMDSLKSTQQQVYEMANIETKFKTKIDQFRAVIDEMQQENRVLEEKVKRLTNGAQAKDAVYKEAIEMNKSLLMKEADYIRNIDENVNQLKTLRMDFDYQIIVCKGHQLAIEEKTMAINKLREIIEGAFSIRLRNMAKNCLMVTTASLYKIHMLPVVPSKPRKTGSTPAMTADNLHLVIQ